MNLVLEDYFKEEHYEYDDISTSSMEALLAFFNGPVLEQWPNLMFGTVLQDIRQEKGTWSATIKRFKTKELCLVHCTMPCTYVMTGKSL